MVMSRCPISEKEVASQGSLTLALYTAQTNSQIDRTHRSDVSKRFMRTPSHSAHFRS